MYKCENPAVGISEFKEQPRERALQADEMERFFQALQTEPDANFKDFFSFLFVYGATKIKRPSNAMGRHRLHKQDMDNTRRENEERSITCVGLEPN